MQPSLPAPSSLSSPVRTGAGAVAFLESLVRPDPRPLASRREFAQRCVRGLLRGVGEPHRGLRVIHIAGSKGKGSTALFAESILQAAGVRTGTFTSPHLERWTERFRLDGSEVDAQRLAPLFERLRPHVVSLWNRDPCHAPTFFDVATAAALLLFREESVDCAIIEAGIGGRSDATNVVLPAVSCITGIELEHTELLGGDLAGIAEEKAGIIKPDVPLILGAVPAVAEEVIRREAQVRRAPLVHLGHGLRLARGVTSGLCTSLSVELDALRLHATLDSPAPHLAGCAALALACVQRTGLLDESGLLEAARYALPRVHPPARCELLRRAPWVVVDAAHTPDSVRALGHVLGALPVASRRFVLSISGERQVRALCAPLMAHAAGVTVTRADPQRSMDPDRLAEALRSLPSPPPIEVEPDPAVAVRRALRALGPRDLLCITGSVYMAGLGRRIVLDPGLGRIDIMMNDSYHHDVASDDHRKRSPRFEEPSSELESR